MHYVEAKNMNQPTWNVNQPISRSDSVKSSKSEQSVKSPPPKKQEKRTLPEEIPLPEDSDERKMDTEQAQSNTTNASLTTSENKMAIEEDLRLIRIEVAELKKPNDLLRHINKTQIENHAMILKHVEAEHLKSIKVFGDEHNKALQEISKLRNENHLLKARKEVISASYDLEKENSEEYPEEKCIIEEKCIGDCKHIVEEDLKNLQLGGKRITPLENTEDPRCPQYNNTFQNKTAMAQHV